MDFKIGADENFVDAEIIDLGIPGAPKIIALAATQTATREQKTELLQNLENHCVSNAGHYSLIAGSNAAPDFSALVSDKWGTGEIVHFYVFNKENFQPLHQEIPQTFEQTKPELLLEYLSDLYQIPVQDAEKSLVSLQAKWQHFSSTIYLRVIADQVVSAAEVHRQQDRFSLDMLGTRAVQQNQGHATRLYSFLLNHILEQVPEHTAVTDASNLAMQRIFEKLGGVLTDTQTTWSRLT